MMITAEVRSSCPRRACDWCLEYTSDYINLSTNMDGKEGVAAPLLTYCKCYVVILENWYAHPLGERKKTLMVSRSFLIQVSSAEECTHITKLSGKWFKTWEKRKIFH